MFSAGGANPVRDSPRDSEVGRERERAAVPSHGAARSSWTLGPRGRFRRCEVVPSITCSTAWLRDSVNVDTLESAALRAHPITSGPGLGTGTQVDVVDNARREGHDEGCCNPPRPYALVSKRRRHGVNRRSCLQRAWRNNHQSLTLTPHLPRIGNPRGGTRPAGVDTWQETSAAPATPSPASSVVPALSLFTNATAVRLNGSPVGMAVDGTGFRLSTHVDLAPIVDVPDPCGAQGTKTD